MFGVLFTPHSVCEKQIQKKHSSVQTECCPKQRLQCKPMMFSFAEGETTSAIIRSVSIAARYGVSRASLSTKANDGLSPSSDGVVQTLAFITVLNASCLSRRYSLKHM